MKSVISYRDHEALGYYYPSMAMAVRALGLSSSTCISYACQPVRTKHGKRRRTVKGWFWRYA